ncbi:5-formyltetrahydrofolate cyclo-ligase mitochondrial isoform X4 [Prunus yedoensis var. nudiflora]|uniref:5-formyltetrahydrofolate cyclo-ligase mitochondrial isoform X4 n=1 Tax=Prunus yedoensis var. nudiflora TaxID=2094558 RepID=A0A314ZJA3_PRUYE|nr:5-formyltetrahydrofolate cyclo-ligase mitochondrial isoform X4 [Prunus yedoensis var. nudiflora]
MFNHSRASASGLINRAKEVVTLITQPRTLASPPLFTSRPTNECLASQSHSSFATMNRNDDPIEALFQQKRSLRSRISKELRNMDPVRRSEEDAAIQSIVVNAPWFKSSKSVCAYISSPALREVDTTRIVSEILSKPANEGDVRNRKKLYVPRVEDRNSNMRMLRISSVDDLIVNSMNILEPALSDSDGKQHEDVMEAREPVDLFILPKYQELTKERKWNEPLRVALSYSIQIVEEGAIAVTSNDVSVGALVSPAGFIPISPAAWERSMG